MKDRLSILVIIASFFSASVNGESAIEPVTGFDVNNYLGTWFEIARMPSRFEKNLIRVTATYSLKKNGMIKVENRGITNRTLKRKRAIGKAKFAGRQDIGYLKVSFFGPFYADYKIIALDSNYRYALVGSSMKYVWILSRVPQLDKSILDNLVDKARNLGYATENLYFTPQ